MRLGVVGGHACSQKGRHGVPGESADGILQDAGPGGGRSRGRIRKPVTARHTVGVRLFAVRGGVDQGHWLVGTVEADDTLKQLIRVGKGLECSLGVLASTPAQAAVQAAPDPAAVVRARAGRLAGRARRELGCKDLGGTGLGHPHQAPAGSERRTPVFGTAGGDGRREEPAERARASTRAEGSRTQAQSASANRWHRPNVKDCGDFGVN